ncbi:RNA polymerase sigma factor [Pseudomonadota bacterium]
MANWQAIITELPALRRYARALAKDVDRADDLVQLTVEKAVRKWSLYSQGQKLRPWLFQILHNQFIDEFRRERLQPTALDPETLNTKADQNVAVTSLRIDLEMAIKQLSKDHLDIFLLASLEEFSYKEIGKILRIPVGTVMSRLARAREQLRTLMTSYRESNTNVKVLNQTFRNRLTDIDKEGGT